MAVAVERYLSVCHPTYIFPGKSLLIPLPIAFAIIYNIPRFFELTTCTNAEMLESATSKTLQYEGQQELGNSDFPKENVSTVNVNITNYSALLQSGIYNDSTIYDHANLTEIPILNITSLFPQNNETGAIEQCDSSGIRPTLLRKNPQYIIFYIFWSKIILIEVVPWIMVIVLNILTWNGLRRFQQNRREILRRSNRDDSGIWLC